ncbi:MAG: CBS domain-containing protein [Gammaproteobacteria bacterium]|nr:MAG: CBS domain-containing protein [Gammaproteobacteria bacterium]
MARDAITVQRDTSFTDCINLMQQHPIPHLPVMEAGLAVGIVSLRDLFLGAMEEAIGSRNAATDSG